FYMAHCRVVSKSPAWTDTFGLHREAEFRNNIMLLGAKVHVGNTIAWGGGKAGFHNNLVAGKGAFVAIPFTPDDAKDFHFSFSRNTLIGAGLKLHLQTEPPKTGMPPVRARLFLHVKENIIDPRGSEEPVVLYFHQQRVIEQPKARALSPREA